MNSTNKHNKHESTEQDRVLVIQSIPREQFEKTSKERLKKATEGKNVPHVVNFEDPGKLRKIFTEKRMELIEKIKELSPESIRDLARKLNRGVREVHEDLTLLESYDIVDFLDEGRAKKPRVPYDQIEVQVSLINQAEAVHEESL